MGGCRHGLSSHERAVSGRLRAGSGWTLAMVGNHISSGLPMQSRSNSTCDPVGSVGGKSGTGYALRACVGIASAGGVNPAAVLLRPDAVGRPAYSETSDACLFTCWLVKPPLLCAPL